MLEERDLDAAVTAGVLDGATRDALVKFARDHRLGEVGPDAFAECLRQADFNYAYEVADGEEGDDT